MSHSTRRTGLVLFGFITWLGTAALACGPFLPHQIPPDTDHPAVSPAQAGFDKPSNTQTLSDNAGANDVAISDSDRVVGGYRQR